MVDFKKGDKVICIDIGRNNNITLYKIYTVLYTFDGMTNCYVEILDDDGDKVSRFIKRFIPDSPLARAIYCKEKK